MSLFSSKKKKYSFSSENSLEILFAIERENFWLGIFGLFQNSVCETTLDKHWLKIAAREGAQEGKDESEIGAGSVGERERERFERIWRKNCARRVPLPNVGAVFW